MDQLDIIAAFTTTPPPQDFVLPGFLAGSVGALVAPGSTGKSMLALQLACAVASESPGANTTGLRITAHGPVLYLNLEDPPAEVQRRLHALGQHFDMATRESVAESLRMVPRMGLPTDVMNTKFFERELLPAAEGCRLVIIDTLSRAHGCDENDNGAMSRVVARLEQVVRKTGASVLFLHHTSKAAALAGQGGMAQAARGASALTDNARWCGNLIKMTTEEAGKLLAPGGYRTIGTERAGFYVRYEIGKQNYGQVQSGAWYERTAGGILQRVELSDRSAGRGGRDVV